jgi:hypothetical protein
MSAAAKPTITICCSCNFYRHAIEVKEKLEQLGYRVIVPVTALEMQQRNDFEVSHYKTWFADEGDYPEKARLIREHLEEVARGDAILVINDEKRGIKNYIGGNVLMEMCLAFYLKKPIFILYDFPEDSAYLEELKGMLPTLLHGKLADLPQSLKLTK